LLAPRREPAFNVRVVGAWIAPAAVAAVAWLRLLSRGRARGATKRALLRLTLLALAAGVLAVGAQRGLWTQTSLGFRFMLLAALLLVEVGYLYLIRFCPSCGRMVRNLRPPTCPRCGAWLPIHGLTSRVRRPGDDRLWDPMQKRERPPRHFEGPRA
jgi:hypothetical protein